MRGAIDQDEEHLAIPTFYAPVSELGVPVDCQSPRTGLMVTRAARKTIWFTENDFGCIRCYLGG
jgi:hypothetical protein